jgi:hypothetical protein
MDGLARALRSAARRWPVLHRQRKWWFRPVYEGVVFVVELVCLRWLVQG